MLYNFVSFSQLFIIAATLPENMNEPAVGIEWLNNQSYI
jgi:hypothetical protein